MAEYLVVSADAINDLTAQVNTYAQHGYVPCGGIAAHSWVWDGRKGGGEEVTEYLQALIKD